MSGWKAEALAGVRVCGEGSVVSAVGGDVEVWGDPELDGRRRSVGGVDVLHLVDVP